jgi:hypothetical protein
LGDEACGPHQQLGVTRNQVIRDLRWKNWWKIVPCDIFDDSLGLFLYACVYCV